MRFYLHGAYLRPENLLVVARAAEDAGFHGLTMSDHLCYPRAVADDPADVRVPHRSPWPDAWVAIAAMSAVTSRLRFVSAIYLAALRDPIVVARAVATASTISQERVAFGLGVGWLKEEFEAVGADFHTRGARTDELVEVVRRLWTGDWVEHHGRFYDFGALALDPAPRADIPILAGGFSPAALRRAARLDGWIGPDVTVEQAEPLLRQLDSERAAAGSDTRSDYEVMVGLTPEATLDDCARLAELGVTSIWVQPWETSTPPTRIDPGTEQVLRTLDRYAGAIA